MYSSEWSSVIYATDKDAKGKAVDREFMKRVVAYAKPYWKKIAMILVSIAFKQGFDLLPLLVYRAILDDALPNKDHAQLNRLAVAMFVLPLVIALIGTVRSYYVAVIGNEMNCDLRVALYSHLQRSSLRFFTASKTGEIMSRLNSDVRGAKSAITDTFITVTTNIIKVVFTITAMLAIEWRLTLVGVLVLPLFILPGRRVASKLRGVVREQMNAYAKMSALSQETLNVAGIHLQKVFGMRAYNEKRYNEAAQETADASVRVQALGIWLGVGLGLVSALGTSIVYWWGGSMVIKDTLSIGTIVALTGYLTQLYSPITQLVNSRVNIAKSLVSFERVFEVLDMPLEITDKNDAIPLRGVEGRVTFNNVSFSYFEGDQVRLTTADRLWPRNMGMGGKITDYDVTKSHGGRHYALEEVSFEIPAGTLTAVVGPSGAGKTTLSYLVPRLYDATSGAVLIDGYNVKDVTLQSIAEAIGVVSQDTHLFHDTVKENLLYAKPDATQDELEAACRAAYIHDVIMEMPEGYDTVVGERGYKCSGGERSRLAIARVVLRNPRILILDEATASLDSRSELIIQQALDEMMVGRSSIVIAHRLSTVVKADQILVVDEGRVVERGTHSELVALGGIYTDLYNTQFRRDEVAGVTEDGEVVMDPDSSAPGAGAAGVGGLVSADSLDDIFGVAAVPVSPTHGAGVGNGVGAGSTTTDGTSVDVNKAPLGLMDTLRPTVNVAFDSSDDDGDTGDNGGRNNESGGSLL